VSGPYPAVIGIRPDPHSIGPPGPHLRWSFPAEKGFPPGDSSIEPRAGADAAEVTAIAWTA
jgi:hypothetical protein